MSRHYAQTLFPVLVGAAADEKSMFQLVDSDIYDLFDAGFWIRFILEWLFVFGLKLSKLTVTAGPTSLTIDLSSILDPLFSSSDTY